MVFSFPSEVKFTQNEIHISEIYHHQFWQMHKIVEPKTGQNTEFFLHTQKVLSYPFPIIILTPQQDNHSFSFLNYTD